MEGVSVHSMASQPICDCNLTELSMYPHMYIISTYKLEACVLFLAKSGVPLNNPNPNANLTLMLTQITTSVTTTLGAVFALNLTQIFLLPYKLCEIQSLRLISHNQNFFVSALCMKPDSWMATLSRSLV